MSHANRQSDTQQHADAAGNDRGLDGTGEIIGRRNRGAIGGPAKSIGQRIAKLLSVRRSG